MNQIDYMNDFYCQKVLPIVYDDSLSYYEVLCKLRKLVNDVINNQNILIDWFLQLEKLLDTKIKEYTENQMNKWLDDGTLANLINKQLWDELQKQIDGLNSSLETNMNEITKLQGDFYIVKKNDNLQEILNTYKMVFIPSDIEILTSVTLKTGFDGQYIKGANSIIKNISQQSSNVSNRISTLVVEHKNVTIEGITFIGEQEYNSTTTLEDISTGHNVYINANDKAYCKIINCTAINGYNGFTCESGTSEVIITNCITINCEHGIQIFNSNNIVVENHQHYIKPYGKSLGYSQRSIKIQAGCKNIVINNCTIELGRIAGIYIRNETSDSITNDNIQIKGISFRVGTSNVVDFSPFTAIYMQQWGGDFNNITLSDISGTVPTHGIRLQISDNKNINKLSINNVSLNCGIGRVIACDTTSGYSGLVNNVAINNVIGNVIFIRGNGVISNTILDERLGCIGDFAMLNNINKQTKTIREIIYINGVVQTGVRVAYPVNTTKDNIVVLNCQRDNASGIYVNMDYTLTTTGIGLDETNALNRNYKLILGVV